MAPLLTLAIPTWNRRPSLQRLLEGLRQQAAPFTPDTIEVVVSDNASDDGTSSMLDAFRTLPGFRVNTNAKNFGFAGNVVLLHRMATGKFLWYIGDDDQLAPAYLPYLVEQLARSSADIYYLPNQQLQWPANTAGMLSMEPAILPLHQVLNRHGLVGILGGLGCTAFRREALDSFDRALSFSTTFPHCFAIAESFATKLCQVTSRTAFIVPPVDADFLNAYSKRWTPEGYYNESWIRFMKALMYVVDRHKSSFALSSTFFRMYCTDQHPLHYHVYRDIAMRLHARPNSVTDQEWLLIGKFNNLLGCPYYSDVLRSLYGHSGNPAAIRDYAVAKLSAPHRTFQNVG